MTIIFVLKIDFESLRKKKIVNVSPSILFLIKMFNFYFFKTKLNEWKLFGILLENSLYIFLNDILLFS